MGRFSEYDRKFGIESLSFDELKEEEKDRLVSAFLADLKREDSTPEALVALIEANPLVPCAWDSDIPFSTFIQPVKAGTYGK